MLIYHPAQDANHCVFRTLLLLEQTEHDEIDIDLYRLLDFYLLFPHLLKNISPLPVELIKYKSILAKIPEPFESMLNTKRIIYDLESLQTVTLHNLLAKKIIDVNSFKENKLRRTSDTLPDDLIIAIKSSNKIKEEWFSMIVHDLPKVNFGGNTGLKKRAGLMEYRYDMEN